jgi:hypothetical protein
MPSVGFEPTIPAFERAKTVHALDRAVTVMGHLDLLPRSRMVELYTHSPIRLHGVVFN